MSETNGRRARKYRNYSDSEKAAALVTLDLCAGNESEASRKLGIPRKTLHEWAEERGVTPDVAEIRQEKKANLADTLEDLAFTLAERLGTSEKTSGVDLGIVVDKMLLLRGEPNSISKDVTHATPEQRRERILQLVQKAKVA